MVIFLALLTALANAVASICQRLGVEDAPSPNGPTLTLVRYMVQRPIWLMGFAIMAAGYVSQAVALHVGSLNLVQPLLVAELVLLVALLWLWFDTPLRPRDLLSAVATATGLASFLAVAAPSVGSRVPNAKEWIIASVAIVAATTGLSLGGLRGPAWRRALLLGAGASTGFALLAAITKSLTDQFAVGIGAVFGSWQLYALCVIGVGSFVLMQSAFQVGPFAVSQSALILVNPFVSIAVGRVLYGESLRSSAVAVLCEVLSLFVMIAGAVGLSASPLVAQVHDESVGHHLLKGRGRYAQRAARRSLAASLRKRHEPETDPPLA